MVCSGVTRSLGVTYSTAVTKNYNYRTPFVVADTVVADADCRFPLLRSIKGSGCKSCPVSQTRLRTNVGNTPPIPTSTIFTKEDCSTTYSEVIKTTRGIQIRVCRVRRIADLSDEHVHQA
jgi:hypothetical protein